MKAKSARRTVSVARGAGKTIGSVSYRAGRVRGRLDSKRSLAAAVGFFVACSAAGAAAGFVIGREPAAG